MFKFTKKLEIIINDLFFLFLSRIGLANQAKILWGRSPYLKYGPGIRTRRVKKLLDKELLDKNIIYMQSHWPWYEIIIYTFTAKFLRIKIIFNQNGTYSRYYKKFFNLYNNVLLFGILNADYVIFQSRYCFDSVRKAGGF